METRCTLIDAYNVRNNKQTHVAGHVMLNPNDAGLIFSASDIIFMSYIGRHVKTYQCHF